MDVHPALPRLDRAILLHLVCAVSERRLYRAVQDYAEPFCIEYLRQRAKFRPDSCVYGPRVHGLRRRTVLDKVIQPSLISGPSGR